MMRKNTQKKCRTKIDGKKSAPYGSAGSKKFLLKLEVLLATSSNVYVLAKIINRIILLSLVIRVVRG